MGAGPSTFWPPYSEVADWQASIPYEGLTTWNYLDKPRYVLNTGGQSSGGQVFLWEVSAGAYSEEVGVPFSPQSPIPYSQIIVAGQPLDARGKRFILAPNNKQIDVTELVNSDAYSPGYGLSQRSLVSLTVVSTNAAQVDSNDWVAIMTPTTNYVYVQATLTTTDPTAATNIQWTGGSVVPGNPFEIQIPTTSPSSNYVSATVGSTKLSFNVWVIWSTINILTGGPSPTNAPLPPYSWMSNTLGIILYSDGQTALGQMCVVATVLPPGVQTVLSNGWGISQNLMSHGFRDGTNFPMWYFDYWTNDFNPTFYQYETFNPDTNGNLYAIDGPGISLFGATNASERYMNFYDWVTWESQVCSSTNNFWHFEGRCKASSVPVVTFSNLNTGAIALPTSPFYPAP